MIKAKINGTKVTTGEVRISFPYLFAPDDSDMGGGKYSVTLLISKSNKETVTMINKAIEEAKAEGRSKKWGGTIPHKCWTPLRDGDEEKDTEKYPEYEGCYYIKAKSNRQPGVVDRHVQPILDQEEVYSGMYARVSLNFFAYSASGSNGVSAALGNVQKLKDGERLGGSAATPDADFEEEEMDDEDLLGLS